jgi:hypothetical protein
MQRCGCISRRKSNRRIAMDKKLSTVSCILQGSGVEARLFSRFWYFPGHECPPFGGFGRVELRDK